MFLLPNNTNRVQYGEALIICPISRFLFLFKKNTLRNKIYRVSSQIFAVTNQQEGNANLFQS